MAIYGYIFKSNSYSTLSEDKGLMKSLHCDVIIEEDGIQEKLRPEWRKMLCSLEKGDTIIITKLSHALRGIRKLGVFLDLCRNYKIRLISKLLKLSLESILLVVVVAVCISPAYAEICIRSSLILIMTEIAV